LARLKRSDVEQTISSIYKARTRKARQMLAMQFTKELLSDSCTDVKFTIRQLVRLWNKVRQPQ